VNLLLGAIFKPVALDATDLDVYYGFTELTGGSGLVLVYCCICCCIALALVHRVVLAGFVATGAYLFFFILKFHRHMYLAIALAILICMALTYSMHRERVLKIISAAILLVFLAGSLIAWGPRVVSRYADLSIKRALSLHGIKSTATVTYRLRENEYAIRMIRANPFIGIGFARPYRPPLYTARNDAMDRFVHNGYLWILLKMGLVGFAAFLWFSGVFIWRGLTRWSTLGDPFFRGVVLGTTVAYLGLCFCNMTSPYFMKDWGVAFIGIMFGINEVAYRCDAQTRLDAALGRAVA
jgi:O-antigen ligase